MDAAKLKDFILLGKKAAALLGDASSASPRVVLEQDRNNTTTITLISSCFPFFEQTYLTVAPDELDAVLSKCRAFVSNLETGIAVKENVEESMTKPGGTLVSIRTKDINLDYIFQVCKHHRRHPKWILNSHLRKLHCTCECIKILPDGVVEKVKLRSESQERALAVHNKNFEKKYGRKRHERK